jgi:hypothetical protein
MNVSLTRYGLVAGLAVGAVVLTGCGSSGSKTNAGGSTVPSTSTSDSAAPTDSSAPNPSASSNPSGQASAPAYTGPTVGPGHKCGTITVVAGSIQCSHADKIFALYAQNKKADGKAVFNGWSCLKATTDVVCSRSGVKLRSAA